MKLSKRLMAMLLCCLMFVSMLPVSAFAAEDTELAEEVQVEEQFGDETAGEAADPAPEGMNGENPNPGEENGEPIPAEPNPPEDDVAEPVEVRFVLTPAAATITVYRTDEQGERTVLPPEVDGSWHLLPGNYCYSVQAEGYVTVEECFEVPADAEDALTITVEMLPAEPEEEAEIDTMAVVSSGTCGTNLTWTLDNQGLLTISGTGEMEDYDPYRYRPAPWYDAELEDTIHSIVIEDGVTKIGEDAFSRCHSLEKVTIPASVTSIGSCAFDGCYSLTKVYINDLEAWCRISFNGDNSCASNPLSPGKGKLYLNNSLVRELVIPNGMMSIGNYSFYGCSSLASVSIPNSVTSIGTGAFSECSALQSVTIPESVTSIGRSAFSGCVSLQSVMLPESVTSIGGSAFSGCGSLQSMRIPDGVTTVAYSTFSGCSSLQSVRIPDGVTTIDYDAFNGCSSLQNVKIPDSVTSIGGSAFSDCGSLQSMRIPDGVTTVAYSTFSGCSSLQSVRIPDSVWKIENYAFEYSGLTDVTIPAGVTNLGESVFKGCSSLTSVTILNCGSSIEKRTFQGCSALTRISLPSSLGIGYIEEDAFDGCYSLTDVYFTGTADQWHIIIRSGNSYFKRATIHYNSTMPGGSITNSVDAHGSDYTTSLILAAKLDEIFSGNLALYTDNKCKNAKIAPLGCYDLKNSNSYTYYVGVKGEKAKNSGTSCWIYAQAVYYSLFGEVAFAGDGTLRTQSRSDGKNTISTKVVSGNLPMSYENFIAWGIRNAPGAHIRKSGHSMILLSYDAGGYTVVEGNAKGNGLVRIDKKSWSGKVDYIIQPTDEAFYDLYPDFDLKHYPTYGRLTAQTSAMIKEEPYHSAANVIFMLAGDMVYATEIVQNKEGEYWYRVEYDGGEGYVFGGYYDSGEIPVTAVDIKSVSIENLTLPEAVHRQGVPISLSGTVVSLYMPIEEISISVQEINNNTGERQLVFHKTSNNRVVKNYQLSDAQAVKELETQSVNFRNGLYQVDLSVSVSYYTLEYESGNVSLKKETGTADGYTGQMQTQIKNWVAYDANGGENAPEVQYKENGSTLMLSAVQPTRFGYRFKGWGVEVTRNNNKIIELRYPVGQQHGFMFNANLMLYAVWEQVTGPVTARYNANVGGGAKGRRTMSTQAPIIAGSEVPDPQTVEAGSEMFIPRLEPTREGYRFRGWSDNEAGNGTLYQPGQRYVMIDDITFYAVWEAQSWPVTFDGNGGENAPEKQSKIRQTPLTLSDCIPTMDGYVFLGWAENPDVCIPSFLPGDTYEADQALTLYAVWQAEGMYSVGYHANGGEGAPANQTAETGTEVQLDAATPIRSGYEFLGWALSPDAAEPVYSPGETVSAGNSMDLYAVWQLVPEMLEIRFNTNGGEGSLYAQAGTDGETVTLSSTVPVRRGYDFLGWALDPASETADYQPGDSFPVSGSSLTLTALWTPRIITVSYDANGGENAPGEDTIRFGDYYVISGEMPSKENAIFLGWAENADAKEPLYRPGSRFDGEETITLYAVWQEIVYIISYDVNGGEGDALPQEKPKGEMIYLSAAEPEHEQYDFLGWARDRNATEAEFKPWDAYCEDADLILYAVWAGSWLTVNYDANGGDNAPEPQTATYWNDLFITWEKPKRAGYTFLGWSTDPNAKAAEYVPGDLYEDDCDVTLFAVWLEGETWIELTQEYLTLSANGEPVRIEATVFAPGEKPRIQWSVNSDNNAVTVSDDGIIYPVAAGTAYVIASLEGPNGKPYASARCRIDVVPNEDESDTPIADDVHLPENGVALLDTKATVELYRTDYARIRVVPNLSQNSTQSVEDVIPQGAVEDGTGAAITSAYFADETVAGLFALRVADDRTLEVVPLDSTLELGQTAPKSIKGSYTSKIMVVLENRIDIPFPAGTVKLTVKKSLPKVKAAPVKLNSWMPTFADEQPLVFTGGKITAIEPLNAGSLPWLAMGEDNGSIVYNDAAGLKKSGKQGLLLTVEGWSIKVPVSVSVSAASTAPKLKFSPAALTLKPGTNDSMSTTVSFTPALFAERTVKVGAVMEGKNDVTDDGVLTAEYDEATHVLTVKPGVAVSDGAHTYKLWLQVDGADAAAVTVKTLAAKSAVALSVKAAGTIDTAIPNSPITLTPSWKNYHPGDEDTVSIVQIQKALGKAEAEDITAQFNIVPDGAGFIIMVKTAEELPEGQEAFAWEKGYTYSAVLEGDYGAAEPAEAAVKLNIKGSAKAPAVSFAVKAAGSVDVLRPKTTAITLTPTVKNWFNYDLNDIEVSFTAKNGKEDVTDQIGAALDYAVENGTIVITAAPDALLNHSWKYSATVKLPTLPATESVYTKTVALKIVQGKAAVTQSTKAVELLKRDKYSAATVMLMPTDEQLSIAEVKLDAKSATLYDLVSLGDDTWELRYLNHEFRNQKNGTVKLQVFLAGNETLKPNVTLSLKVTIR